MVCRLLLLLLLAGGSWGETRAVPSQGAGARRGRGGNRGETGCHQPADDGEGLHRRQGDK